MYFMHISVSGRSVILFNKLIVESVFEPLRQQTDTQIKGGENRTLPASAFGVE